MDKEIVAISVAEQVELVLAIPQTKNDVGRVVIKEQHAWRQVVGEQPVISFGDRRITNFGTGDVDDCGGSEIDLVVKIGS